MSLIAPYAGGLRWNGIQHGGPPWRGVCIAGLYIGTRTFQKRRGPVSISGVFGMVGLVPQCKRPARFRCQLFVDGRLLPFWWMACDDKSHQENAGVIEKLDAQGWVVETIRVAPEYMETEREGPPLIPQALPAGRAVPKLPPSPQGYVPRRGRKSR